MMPDYKKSVRELVELSEHIGSDALFLWFDALALKGHSADQDTGDGFRITYTRAAIVMAAAAFEGYMNFVAAKLVSNGNVLGRQLTEPEVNCLLERESYVDNGAFKLRKRIYRSMDRFLLLYAIVNGGEQLNEKLRRGLEKAFKVRDGIIHPKPSVQPRSLSSESSESTFYTFFTADLFIARAWFKTFGGVSEHLIAKN
jgi:hypothetical protein